MRNYIFIVLLIVLFVMLPEIYEAQCAMCKASVESSAGQKNSVAAGINKGILYLMAVPYLLLLFIFRKQIVSLWRTMKGKETEAED